MVTTEISKSKFLTHINVIGDVVCHERSCRHPHLEGFEDQERR